MLALAVTDAQKSSIAGHCTQQNHCILRVGVEKVTQTPQLAMKVQQKITRYGVVPVASLAGAAPGPVPRTDPPSATGQREERFAKQSITCKTHALGKPTDSHNQTTIIYGTKKRNVKDHDMFVSSNVNGVVGHLLV